MGNRSLLSRQQNVFKRLQSVKRRQAFLYVYKETFHYHLTKICITPTIHLSNAKGVQPLNLDFGKPIPGGEPIYLQIIRQFKLLILQGQFKDGAEVPSRRLLAARLGVNPNTVQKAFAELEKDGLIQTPPNAKSVVHVDDAVLTRLRVELLEGQVSAVVEAAKVAGLSREELVAMIHQNWDETRSIN